MTVLWRNSASLFLTHNIFPLFVFTLSFTMEIPEPTPKARSSVRLFLKSRDACSGLH